MERPMQKLNDLSPIPEPPRPGRHADRRYRTEPVELAPRPHRAGRERQPLKKLAVDESTLLKLLHRWREEAAKAGHRIKRIAVSFEAGRDGFWLARWLSARDTEAHVIHASSVAVSRE